MSPDHIKEAASACSEFLADAEPADFPNDPGLTTWILQGLAVAAVAVLSFLIFAWSTQ